MLFHGLKGVTAEDIYQQGLSAWKKGDFESAAKFFEDAVPKNHPGAMLKLADMYGYGQYFTCNAQKETDYTIRAAEAGLAEAQAILATMYAEGHFNILPKDMLTASTWLTKSLDHDCEIAYAIALLYGLCGFPKDLQQSAARRSGNGSILLLPVGNVRKWRSKQCVRRNDC